MKLPNIDNVLLFATNPRGGVLTLEELAQKYGFEPDGTNFYYGFDQQNVQVLKKTKSSFSASHVSFFNSLLASIKTSSASAKTLVLGLEPTQLPDPYSFVASNLALAHQLALDLKQVQDEAHAAQKTLNIVIRYGSEMNDHGQVQGRDPAGFRRTFALVRQAFALVNPSVLFSFSPAIRADLSEAVLGDYWPGDQFVDIIGGTWYVNGAEQRSASFANMRAYVLHRAGAGRPFAFSELGGCGSAGMQNDTMLQDMLNELATLGSQGVSFRYATIFLQNQWGVDATLAFLNLTTDGPQIA